jgi:hypothetical protein
MNTLKKNYRGADLCLELDNDDARLLINGISRDQGTVTSSLRLSSTVQTDYELHEFIQGVIIRNDNSLTAKLIAGNTDIASEDFTA